MRTLELIGLGIQSDRSRPAKDVIYANNIFIQGPVKSASVINVKIKKRREGIPARSIAENKNQQHKENESWNGKISTW
jgi:hypothetical protein